MLVNRLLNVLCSVSVRISVPETNVTPSTIAIAASATRSLRASRPLMVTFHMSGAHRPHPLQDRVLGRILHLSGQVDVGEEDDAGRVGGAARVVSDHDDRLRQLLPRRAQEP